MKVCTEGVFPNRCAGALLLFLTLTARGTVLYVDSNSTNPQPPYASWATAATVIQDAIDAAGSGDTVLVTNGTYATGGRAIVGSLTNRVALYKALVVQSVNGPAVTTIQGAWDPATTNGPLAIRGAWVTNGATLSGFTIQGGATQGAAGGYDYARLQCGGGIWCYSTSASIENCLVRSNSATQYGGGTYSGTLSNCSIAGNFAGMGGGAYNGVLNNCKVSNNSATASGGGWYASGTGYARNCWIAYNVAGKSGGGVYGSNTALTNCTVVGNSAASSGGVYWCSPVNCIVYYNLPSDGASSGYYSCSPGLQSGSGNITTAPALLPDGLHLSNASPCIGAGLPSAASGTDLDGQPWSTPPAMGCEEWHAAAALASQPRAQPAADGTQIGVGVLTAGQGPFTCWWFKDGQPVEDGPHYTTAHSTCLGIQEFSPADSGAYQVIVSNAFGMVTSQVAQVTAHFVDLASPAPLAPYLDWTSAATNIQEAINASSDGDVVLVTNGVYASGGKVEAGDLTNRVALDKAILVQSVNGPCATVIQGAWGSYTNGPTAVRCAWLADQACLSGFTLRGGATRTAGDTVTLQSGGGVWGVSTNASLYNCWVVANAAAYLGAGAYRVNLDHCSLLGNVALGTGGGAANCRLGNCTVAGNVAGGSGGGAGNCTLGNCTVTGNFAGNSGGGTTNCVLIACALTSNSSFHFGGGAAGGTLTNCTLWGNFVGDTNSPSPGYVYGGGAYQANLVNCIAYGNGVSYAGSGSNYYNCTFTLSCANPLPAGTGNISTNPQLLRDGIHLAPTSPCRELATTGNPGGTDIDGQPWSSPASIGCDEWQPAPVLCVQPKAQSDVGAGQIHFGPIQTAGQEPFAYFWSKDGASLDEGGKYSGARTNDLLVSALDPADSGNYQVVVSNAFGMATSQVAQVVVHCVNPASANPVPPYTNWQTASLDIQSAIDVAAAGEFVLATNGLYASGGRMMGGAPANRVVVDKALAVLSVNGSAQTTIQGACDPATTNGPAAVRCVWLTNGATLNGFTLQGGATTSGGVGGGGGGVYGPDTAPFPVAANCLILSNSALSGGGAYGVVLNHCSLVGNRASNDGGGAAYSILNSCLVQGNWAAARGGGASSSKLNNCTVVRNSTPGSGGGAYDMGLSYTVITNSIVCFNAASSVPDISSYTRAYNSCAPVPLSGAGNITSDPQLVDGSHLAATSPCRGAGMALSFMDVDIDGELWSNPPSIGCDEVVESDLVGSLSVTLEPPQTNVLVNHALTLSAGITGRAARLAWSFGDGVPAINGSYVASHAWTNAGDFTVTLTAYNTNHPEGVATAALIHVLPLSTPVLQSAGMTTNGFRFQFTAQAGATNVLEMATNLNPPIVWQSLQTLVSTDGVLQVTDPTPTNALRFYRIRAQ